MKPWYHFENGDEYNPFFILKITKAALFFISEFLTNPTKKKDVTNKTDKYYTDETWSMNLLDLGDFGKKIKLIRKFF